MPPGQTKKAEVLNVCCHTIDQPASPDAARAGAQDAWIVAARQSAVRLDPLHETMHARQAQQPQLAFCRPYATLHCRVPYLLLLMLLEIEVRDVEGPAESRR